MSQQKRTLTLGELISAVAEFARNGQELSLAVADLMKRGVVQTRRGHKHFKVIAASR